MRRFFLNIISVVLNISVLSANSLGQSIFVDKTSELGCQLGGGKVAYIDYNNDGWVDIYMGQLWKNEQGKSFTKIFESAPEAVWADFDNDGYSDLFCYSNQSLFRNDKGKLTGDGRTVNSDSIGSQVRIRLKGKTLTRQVEAGTGEGNQNELTLHFGLREHTEPVDLEIVWTKGLTQKLNKIKPNQLVKVMFAEENCLRD